MYTSFRLLLDELDKLWLEKWKYAIYWGWPLAIRGLRESNDIDVIVKTELMEMLEEKFWKFYDSKFNCYIIWNLEVFDSFMDYPIELVDKIINTADIIEWYPFAKIEYVIHYKKILWREKDLRDLKLIENYLNNNV